MSHEHSPAVLLRRVLVTRGLGVLPNSAVSPVWPIEVNHLPNSPDNAICIYDTSGKRDGRIMSTGESISKPGWQIRVRAIGYPIAYAKMKNIQRELDKINRFELVLDGDYYLVSSVTQTGTPLTLGQEPEVSRRCSITLNGTITYKELMT